MNTEELLAKAKKPSADAMRLHPFYRRKIETTLKCTVHSFDDFTIWYTPGVAAPFKTIQANPELVYEYTNKWSKIRIERIRISIAEALDGHYLLVCHPAR